MKKTVTVTTNIMNLLEFVLGLGKAAEYNYYKRSQKENIKLFHKKGYIMFLSIVLFVVVYLN